MKWKSFWRSIMENTVGVIVFKKGDRLLIATQTDLFASDAHNSTFSLGDTVSFAHVPVHDPSRRKDKMQFQTVFDVQPHRKMVDFEMRDDKLLIKTRIIGTYENTISNCQVFRTEFLTTVRDSPTQTGNSNVMIGKIVSVELDMSTRDPHWKIVKVHREENKKIHLTGLVFGNNGARGSRVFVPGYKEEFLIKRSSKFSPADYLGQWVSFVITETAEVDYSQRIVPMNPPFPSNQNMEILFNCSRQDGVIMTRQFNTVQDRRNVLGQYNIPANFHNLDLWVKVSAEFPNRPVFIVSDNQPALGAPIRRPSPPAQSAQNFQVPQSRRVSPPHHLDHRQPQPQLQLNRIFDDLFSDPDSDDELIPRPPMSPSPPPQLNQRLPHHPPPRRVVHQPERMIDNNVNEARRQEANQHRSSPPQDFSSALNDPNFFHPDDDDDEIPIRDLSISPPSIVASPVPIPAPIPQQRPLQRPLKPKAPVQEVPCVIKKEVVAPSSKPKRAGRKLDKNGRPVAPGFNNWPTLVPNPYELKEESQEEQSNDSSSSSISYQQHARESNLRAEIAKLKKELFEKDEKIREMESKYEDPSAKCQRAIKAVETIQRERAHNDDKLWEYLKLYDKKFADRLDQLTRI